MFLIWYGLLPQGHSFIPVLVGQVLASAAQELSTPNVKKSNPSVISAASSDLTPYTGDNAAHWRQVVDMRIQSKTKRHSKVLKLNAHVLICVFSISVKNSELFSNFTCYRGQHILQLRSPQTVTLLLLDTSFFRWSGIMTSEYVLLCKFKSMTTHHKCLYYKNNRTFMYIQNMKCTISLLDLRWPLTCWAVIIWYWAGWSTP